MSTSKKRDVHLNSQSQTGNNRIPLIRRNAGLLALAILGTLLSAKIWGPVAFFLVDTFPVNPALAASSCPGLARFADWGFDAARVGRSWHLPPKDLSNKEITHRLTVTTGTAKVHLHGVSVRAAKDGLTDNVGSLC